MGIPVLEKDDHLLKIKLVLKDTDRVSDEMAEKMFLDTEIKSEDDIRELVNYLGQYRPKLLEKLSVATKQKQETDTNRK
ncbi:MAG: hypothetical protein PHN74_03645 [Candidatus Pacebacteria bacterium]|nr:hypothetical protein [Candidatus Paceibacterota bacterium]